MKMKTSFPLSLLLVMAFSCGISSTNEINFERHHEAFVQTMQAHLDAVTNKDIHALKATMAPNEKMQLILPGEEIMDSVSNFINFHSEWFKMPNWTFETKIVSTTIGEKVGIAITEILYQEPERDGKPYFNRMIVSYALEFIEGKWCIIKDHASSIEKSTDKK